MLTNLQAKLSFGSQYGKQEAATSISDQEDKILKFTMMMALNKS